MTLQVRPLRRCASCNEKLNNEEVVIADNNVYHARHFRCCTCQQEIGLSEQFHSLEKDRLACISCFCANFAPVCSGNYRRCPYFLFKACHKGIVDKCVRATGQYFHQNCLYCKSCGISLSDEFYVDDNGMFVDRDCFWQFRLLKFVANSKQKTVKQDS